MKELIIPVEGVKKTVRSERSFVIVGANGSGKSHLGAWIETNFERPDKVLRISAQRAICIPEVINLKSEEVSYSHILYGDDHTKNKGVKWGWGKETATLVQDFEYVLSGVFARKNKENDNFVSECKHCEEEGVEKPMLPKMISDKIVEIWNAVLPHRQIVLRDCKILAKSPESNEEYHGKDMSDGERVAIYLMGQCLIAPEGTTIIVDEPEIHLNRMIMHRLWDKIEKFCPDKTFVYITHDLEFAASRKESCKIWVKSYHGNSNWELQVIENNDEIPDELMMRVLGSRRPILLVEGEKGSYDYQIYPYIYDNFDIIPAHNCHGVIAMTKALNDPAVRNLLPYDIVGLIDRDYMTEHEINAYREDKIYTLDVAEVENLFLLEPIFKAVTEQLMHNPNEKFKSLHDTLFAKFESEKELQILGMCQKEARHKLTAIDTKTKEKSLEVLKERVERIKASVDIDALYSERKIQVERIISERDYVALLRVYNNKGLHAEANRVLGIGNYRDMVLRMLKSDKGYEMLAALRAVTPVISC
ncbi:MAG: DUF4435 domain-containing protein [Bacteroidales bacterium]|nr:DUF4435 domain-containing protein [Bacteroidales bacterium]